MSERQEVTDETPTVIDYVGARLGTQEQLMQRLCDGLVCYQLAAAWAQDGCEGTMVTQPRGVVTFHGNFVDFSLAFAVRSKSPTVIARLRDLIRDNIAEHYGSMRGARNVCEQEHQDRERENLRRSKEQRKLNRRRP